LLNAIENALARDADNLRHEVKVLNAEVASLKATLAELRLTVADKRKAQGRVVRVAGRTSVPTSSLRAND
jgi:hypothetical protein